MSGPQPEEELQSDTYRFVIESEYAGQRADKVLGALCDDLSRTRIQNLISEGCVMLNHKILEDSSCKLAAGDIVLIDVPPVAPAEPQPENIKLDIVHEDEDLLVINKPAGMVVHPGAGNQTGTLVNALLYHCGDSLSGIGGVARPGIVHRLDKDTSGLIIVAKHDKAHRFLAAQLSDRSLSRTYHAIVLYAPVPHKGTINQPIGRHPSHRLKMTVTKKQGREALTHYTVLENFGAASLVECKLETGRTHQIRVHMEFLGHSLLGDQLYGPQPTALSAALRKAGYPLETIEKVLKFPRQALHAARLAFIHPTGEEPLEFAAPHPADLFNLLKLLEK